MTRKKQPEQLHIGNVLPPPRTSIVQAIKEGIVNEQDGNDLLEYVAEETHLRNWKKTSEGRQYQAAKPFLEHLQREGKTLAGLDKKQVLDLIDFLKRTPWSEDTRASNWNKFFRFYRWVFIKYGKMWNSEAAKMIIGDPPFAKRWTYKRDLNKVLKKDTFTSEELRLLLAAESELCYKAFVATTYQAGLRIGEALSLRVQDVRRNDKGFDIEVQHSKSEKRTVWVEGLFDTYLDRWLATHPRKNDPSAPLFLNTLGQALDQKMANKRLQTRAAKVFPHKKKVSVHSLRHSWATETAAYMNEAQMKIFFGWSPTSDMPATYIRTQKVDVRRVMRRAHGIETHEHEQEATRKCHECALENSVSMTYCAECAQPLDLKEYMRRQEKKRYEALFDDLLRSRFEQYDEKFSQLRDKYEKAGKS